MISYVGRNSIARLREILEREQISSLLVFTGKQSYEYIRSQVECCLQGVDVEYYNDFSTNPKEEEICKATNMIHQNYDAIMAIGGGSVIDFAKAFRYHIAKPCKLIAVPTTSGTGAEATQFAVVYKNGVKTSLDDSSILPDIAIVDSQLTTHASPYLKACTAMDAYCQAIESYWAVGSTEGSRKDAKTAIELCRDYIVDFVMTTSEIAADKMAEASHLAGKAINVSRTTAAHAISYTLTSQYGIPHGQAVAVTIAALAELNANTTSETCTDARGVMHVRHIMQKLSAMLHTQDFSLYFARLFRQINLITDTISLGVTDCRMVADGVNVDRLNNNPRRLSKADIVHMLESNSV